ncbi:MAG: LAGLIDADG family homing endonuclease [Candidatus Harrisonbacteria bacterium]|nr:LAGLIDADG family homing endonuclease [Candidatus Harrisonbacteria bacterium]
MNITDNYIRGLIDGEGCFSFCNIPQKNKHGNKIKIPAFVLSMHERDKELIEQVKRRLNIKNKIYILKPYSLDGFKRGKTARLIVRDFGELRDIIIPFFYKKLIGYKGKQLLEWLEKIGQDPDIHPDYKVLYSLYKRGHFEAKSVSPQTIF